METITVLSKDATAIAANIASRRFDWSAAIAGVAVATAVTFFLVTLGSGFGLAFVPAPASANGLKAFLTVGAIYLFASQAFGFAAGAHITGRLIGPAGENAKEEEFLAGAHGLVVWASTVVTSLAILAFIVLIGGTAAVGGLGANSNRAAAVSGNYWTDMLFRPPGNGQQTANLANDKAEATRILAVDLGDKTSSANRGELARLVSQDAGLSASAALNRVDAVESDMRDDAARAADAARRAAIFMSFWTAFALLFGAIVSVAAAISARWEDDRVSFNWTPRR